MHGIIENKVREEEEKKVLSYSVKCLAHTNRQKTHQRITFSESLSEEVHIRKTTKTF